MSPSHLATAPTVAPFATSPPTDGVRSQIRRDGDEREKPYAIG